MSWSFTLAADFPVQKSYEERSISTIAKSLNVEIEEISFLPISKEEEEGRMIKAVILEPNGDMSKDEVRAECYYWMENSKKSGENGVRVLETMITPVNMRINEKNVKAGSWLMTLKILDDEIWKDFERGEFKISGRSLQEL